jgi:hypothetical protein
VGVAVGSGVGLGVRVLVGVLEGIGEESRVAVGWNAGIGDTARVQPAICTAMKSTIKNPVVFNHVSLLTGVSPLNKQLTGFFQ